MKGHIPDVVRDHGPEPSSHRREGASLSDPQKVGTGLIERLAKLRSQEHAMRLGDLPEVIARVEDHRLPPAFVLLRPHLAATPSAA